MASSEPREVRFDGLVGPTHNYAGLSPGNLASTRNRQRTSNPREAALQGLRKMRFLLSLGLPQGILPPQERPHLPTLRALGFDGDDAEVLRRASREAPELLAAVSSASAMWAANAATVSPRADCADGRTHFTPANLQHHLHRSIEAAQTARALERIFPDPGRFAHHPPLPSTPSMGDEGAANHTRLVDAEGRGVHLFVYGRSDRRGERAPAMHPARHDRRASEAIARRHGLDPERTIYLRQNPAAIDAGVFHNDVIAVGTEEVLLHHARAFAEPDALRRIEEAMGGALRRIEVPEAEVSLEDAVESYLFNSQLFRLDDGRLMLLAPREVRENERVARFVEGAIDDPGCPLGALHTLDLRQSMRNGRGPACLRLRVPLDEAERGAVLEGAMLDEGRLDRLEGWVKRWYRDRLAPADLADPALLEESRSALEELASLMGLGDDFYPFQRT